MNQKNQNIPLDRYEADLVQAIENDEFVPVTDQKSEIDKLTSYAANALKKDKRVTIRIAQHDLDQIQKRALETGIPYQTIVTSVLHQYASGKIEVKL